MLKSVYVIIETKENRNFGIYSTKEKAKKVLKAMVQKVKEQTLYSFPKDNAAGIAML